MIKISSVDKSYGELQVFKSLELTIQRNKINGLLGSNGSGKTTLTKIILNKTFYYGEVTIDGLPNDEYLKNNRVDLISLPDRPFVYDYLTGFEFLCFMLDLNRIPLKNVENNLTLLIKLFDLTDFKDVLVKEYSLGMKQKLSLISVLLQTPKILVLDEPISSIDLQSVLVLKKLLRKLTQSGTTVLLTSHIIEFMENLCDTITILHNKSAISVNNSLMGADKSLEEFYTEITGFNMENELNNISFSSIK